MTSLATFPGLAHLRLPEGHLPVLAEQGSVYHDQHRGKGRYKLRYRTPDAHQIVRCVPIHLVELVRLELEKLQSNRNAASALRESTRGVRETSRNAKRQLQPVLDEHGYHFHG